MSIKLFLVVFLYIIYIIKAQEDHEYEDDPEHEPAPIREFVHFDTHVINNTSTEGGTFAQDWKDFMIDYESEFVHIIPLDINKRVRFYEDIENVPARIRGALIGNKDNKKKFKFLIIDPNGEHVLDSDAKEYIFDFTTHVKGRFTFEFENYKVSQYVIIR